jgi:hypothetical protein
MFFHVLNLIKKEGPLSNRYNKASEILTAGNESMSWTMEALIYDRPLKVKDQQNAFSADLLKTQIVKVTKSIRAYNRGTRLSWRSCLLSGSRGGKVCWLRCHNFVHIRPRYAKCHANGQRFVNDALCSRRVGYRDKEINSLGVVYNFVLVHTLD